MLCVSLAAVHGSTDVGQPAVGSATREGRHFPQQRSTFTDRRHEMWPSSRCWDRCWDSRTTGRGKNAPRIRECAGQRYCVPLPTAESQKCPQISCRSLTFVSAIRRSALTSAFASASSTRRHDVFRVVGMNVGMARRAESRSRIASSTHSFSFSQGTSLTPLCADRLRRHRPDPGVVPLDVGTMSLAFVISWLAVRRRTRRRREQRIANSIPHLLN
jgi:hypothetical protein